LAVLLLLASVGTLSAQGDWDQPFPALVKTPDERDLREPFPS
jgi:hypothetical protein